MKKQWENKIITTGLMLAVTMTMLAGAGAGEAYASTSASRQSSKETVGRLLLNADPEIEISYDKRGRVTDIHGLNKDGRDILQKFSDYQGDSCEAVVEELINLMDSGGYLDPSADGSRKNIIVKLSKDSLLPEDDFLDSIADAARGKVRDHNLDSRVIAVDSDDYEPSYQDKGYLNYETAKQIVKDQLHLDQITFTNKEYDIEDGVYELEFMSNGKKYECEINASNGKVMKMEQDDDMADRNDTAADKHDDRLDEINDDRDDSRVDYDDDDRDDLDDKSDDDNDDLNDGGLNDLDDNDLGDHYDDDNDDDDRSDHYEDDNDDDDRSDYEDDNDDDDRNDHYEDDNDDRDDD